ncbi:hypothetical protein llap_3697 [Limosa lapponica baueri]|uniref:Uncharacterized protein n=1 Tax=Limosa lapponica baueri TaxID=1758121 RepID=A0A2I0UIZ3_LIMLA|nr:hypothetical protein llap_3697 [Limosa lapponica baueri]
MEHLLLHRKVNGADVEWGRVRKTDDTDPEKLETQVEDISMRLRLERLSMLSIFFDVNLKRDNEFTDNYHFSHFGDMPCPLTTLAIT